METSLSVRLLRLPQVEEATGLRRSTIYKKISEGIFPAPCSLGGRAVAWKSDEIEEWILTRPRVDIGIAKGGQLNKEVAQ